jgi:hypothetical protein
MQVGHWHRTPVDWHQPGFTLRPCQRDKGNRSYPMSLVNRETGNRAPLSCNGQGQGLAKGLATSAATTGSTFVQAVVGFTDKGRTRATGNHAPRVVQVDKGGCAPQPPPGQMYIPRPGILAILTRGKMHKFGRHVGQARRWPSIARRTSHRRRTVQRAKTRVGRLLAMASRR